MSNTRKKVYRNNIAVEVHYMLYFLPVILRHITPNTTANTIVDIADLDLSTSYLKITEMCFCICVKCCSHFQGQINKDKYIA